MEKQTNWGKIPKLSLTQTEKGIRQRNEDIASMTAIMEAMMEQLKAMGKGPASGADKMANP